MRTTLTRAPLDTDRLLRTYAEVRDLTVRLCEPLSAEDMVVQVADHASPAKWHLGHTTWFFETMVLEAFDDAFEAYDPRFRVLFNSYYQTVGDQHPRHRRGLLTRPGVGEVMAYRDTVDERLVRLLSCATGERRENIARIVELGLHHEQQHQELLLTDIQLTLSANPVQPSYRVEHDGHEPTRDPGPIGWVPFDAGVVEIGHGDDGFAYDNESPRHRRFLEPYELASRLVTNGEYLAFIEAGGYRDPALWLDDGWSLINREGWTSPLYWREGDDGRWTTYTLGGRVELDTHAPVTHLSFFEADAYARWAGWRLPTEEEWEHAAAPEWDDAANAGGFVEGGALRPLMSAGAGRFAQLAGEAWQWTRSAHEPYPGYTPPEGALGEYNGKFMNGAYVLRGGSCATPRAHARCTYRNFFAPADRWQFTGLRPARSTD